MIKISQIVNYFIKKSYSFLKKKPVVVFLTLLSLCAGIYAFWPHKNEAINWVGDYISGNKAVNNVINNYYKDHKESNQTSENCLKVRFDWVNGVPAVAADSTGCEESTSTPNIK